MGGGLADGLHLGIDVPLIHLPPILEHVSVLALDLLVGQVPPGTTVPSGVPDGKQAEEAVHVDGLGAEVTPFEFASVEGRAVPVGLGLRLDPAIEDGVGVLAPVV